MKKYNYYVQPTNTKEPIKVSRKELINKYLNQWCLKNTAFINDALGYITSTDEKLVKKVLYAITRGNTHCYMLCGHGLVWARVVE